MEPDNDAHPVGRPRGGAETRERILRAMMDMIERGLGAEIQLRDVAREAGVSAALIIRYFGSKSDLLFEALSTRMQEATNPQLIAKDARGAFKSLDDLEKFLLTADLESAYRTITMLEMSWGWRPEQEERWRATQQPRHDIVRRLVEAQAPKAKPAHVAAACRFLELAYGDVLRTALIHGWSPAMALDRLKAPREAILAALRSGAFGA